MILGIVKGFEGLIWVLGTSSSKLLDTPLDECGQKKSSPPLHDCAYT